MKKSSLSDYANSFIDNKEKLSICDFATSKYGLGLKQLFPAQRFYLKLLVGEPLDGATKTIPIKDRFATEILQTLTELEYYSYLLSDNRISCTYSDLQQNQKHVIQYTFCMGRRATKSVMISILVAYKLYELLLHDCPQKYLSVPPSSKIGIIMVGLSQDSSITLFNTFYGLVKESVFFKKHIKEDPNKTGMSFWSSRDLDLIEKGSIGVKGSHTFDVSAVPNSPSVRGSSNIIVVFDEFAHFTNSAHSTKDKPMDKLIYEALVPSVSSFVDPEGHPYGRIYTISSPNGKNNKFHADFKVVFESGVDDSYTLAARAPTWEINTQVNTAFLKKEYNNDVSSYEQEFGAEFLEGGLNWLKDLSSIYYCIDSNKLPDNEQCSDLSKPHFMGIDFGFSNDSSVITIGHFEPFVKRFKNGFVKEAFINNPLLESSISESSEADSDLFKIDKGIFVIDHITVISPGKPPYENFKVLDLELIVDKISYLFQKFPIHLGIYDQYSGHVISQMIAKKGLDKRLEMTNHSQAINDAQYKTFSQLLHTQKILMPNFPEVVKELLQLKVEHNANGTIKVQNAKGHDDIFDSLIRCLFLSYTYYNKPENLSSVIKNSRFYNSSPKDLIKKKTESYLQAANRKTFQLHNGRP